MLKQFQEHIAQQRLCKTTDKILLAVSGGIDSMVMLRLFQASGYKIGVAHCNFQLRGKESDGDEAFVKQTCDQLRVSFFPKRFDTNNYAAEHGVSIQMAARELRYAWFNEILSLENFDLLATAHHRNDSMETVFLNLIHGRGIDGLTGIAVKNKNTIRPLLFALREEIEKFAADESVTWREDVSNKTIDYQRNRIRHDVIPILHELNSNLENTVQRSIEKNEGALELMQLGIEAFESKNVTRGSDRIAINKNAFAIFQHPASVLYQLVKEYHFSLAQCGAVVEALHGQSGKNFLSSTHQLVIDRTELVITENELPVEEILIQKNQLSVISGHWNLEVTETDVISKLNEPYEVTVDAEKLSYPLTWRAWREGDYFYPLGMNHKKKISDFLIDRKMARNDKNHVVVIESGGEILWLVGHQVSNRFKITCDTKRAIRLVMRPYFI